MNSGLLRFAALWVGLSMGGAANAAPRKAIGVADRLLDSGTVTKAELAELHRARGEVLRCIKRAKARREPHPRDHCLSERIVVQQARLAILRRVRSLETTRSMTRLLEHRIARTQARLDKMKGR
jgi:hypothetical protein